MTVVCMDCLDGLKLLGENSVDAIVTDPPYGLSFMGRRWDYDVPGVGIWAECFRVLKPGGCLLAFAGTRTQHRMAVRIEDAGFEIRDMIAWVYGSGFPKSHNGEWGGTALKPALEPITVARKPLVGTVEQNWREYGTGALNIDACRVGDEVRHNAPAGPIAGGSALNMSAVGMPVDAKGRDATGRWPANLIHDGSDEVLAAFPAAPGQLARASTSDTLRAGQDIYGVMNRGPTGQEPRGVASVASRFFYCAKASKRDRDEGLDNSGDRILARSCQAQAQAARGVIHEEASGAFNAARVRKNHHPTVKPTALMRYLVRLVTPPGGLVVDPFAGSGSTGKAAALEGFQFLGFERESDFAEIANARIDAAVTGRVPSTPHDPE